MKRQRAGASIDKEVLSAESNNTPDTALDDHKDTSGGAKSKKRFVGVRQRPSGRWVAEIKDTTQKIRLWLGTFDSAEEGAKAYDSAARALRGANTRTNFVPGMACESTVPASKATRLIRLRQIAAASKASEKEARNVTQSPEPKDHLRRSQDDSKDQVISPLVRQDFQHSSNPRTAVDDTPPHLPSSPPKPARLIGRRHNAPLTSAKADQEDVAPNPTDNDRSAVDRGPKLEVGSFPSPDRSPPKLEPQQSIISENPSNAKNQRLIASLQDSSPTLLRLSLPSCSIPQDCIQPQNLADGEAQLVSSGLSEVAVTNVKFSKQTHYSTQRAEEWHGSSPFESFSTLPVDNFVPQSPNPFLIVPLEASRQQFRTDHNMSGLVGCSHHDASSQQQLSCSTNRDHVSIYQSERYGDLDPGMSNNNAILDRQRSLRSIAQHLNSDDAMTLDAAKCMMEPKCCEPLASSVPKGQMDYTNTEMYGTESEKRSPEICDLREKGFSNLHGPDIPWQDYIWGDTTGMESGLLGLDLSCESSGVYNSTFDFTETIERDSCTSVVEEHLSDNSDFMLRVQFDSSPCTSDSFQECVLLTQPDYCMSPHESSLRGLPLSPPDTHLSNSSPSLWRVNDTSTWDGQSSGSTETTTTTDLKTDGDGAGECTSQDHEALWSSMDLPPLCMVA